MSHRCYMCNRTDDAAVSTNPSEIYRGYYTTDKRYPILEICSECNHSYLSSLGELPEMRSKNTAYPRKEEETYITEIDYDPEFDTYEDDFEDFDYTNYDIEEDHTEQDEIESGDVRW